LSIKQRCYNPKNSDYKLYGARGINVCDRWINSFNNFKEDMGAPPNKLYSIDRINNNGNYEPTNCKWSTRSEQNYNQRVRSDNKLGIRGIMFDKFRNKYRVHIVISGKQKYLGRFENLEEAKLARTEGEKRYI
jgi:hypothetical protein